MISFSLSQKADPKRSGDAILSGKAWIRNPQRRRIHPWFEPRLFEGYEKPEGDRA